MKQLSEKQKTILALAAKKKLSYDTVSSFGGDTRTLDSLIGRGLLAKKLYSAHVNGFHANLWFYEITTAGRAVSCVARRKD